MNQAEPHLQRIWPEYVPKVLPNFPPVDTAMPDTVAETLNARGSNYGRFSGQSAISQKLKETLKSQSKWTSLTTSQQESLEMICHKMARIVNGKADYDDSWRDIAGYAMLVVNQLNGQDV